MLDDFDLDFPEDEEEEISEGRPNRTFLMVAGGLGALIVISLICVVAYILLGGQDGDAEAQAQSQTQTAIAAAAAANQAASQTALAQTPTDTLPPPPTATITPTSTEPSIPTVTEGLGPTADPRTATVQALLTQAAQAQTQAAAELLTASPTSTALPDTGFADDIGAPALLGLAGVLILVIFIARRLREAPA